MAVKKSAKQKQHSVRGKSQKRKVFSKQLPFTFKSILIVVGVAILIAGGFSSYKSYKDSDIETTGVLVCNKEGVCTKSMHIHADIEITICGKKFDLPKDTGNLADTHTHKEDNKLHWHDKVNVDKDGVVTVNENDRKISAVIDTFLKNKLPEKCSDSVNLPVFSLVVNNRQAKDAKNYVWGDGDKLKLIFE